ncbi:L-proline dehydrogenase /delta-1-pyrroline-5-carboxylate dehydrogenase [Palleronia marisminoris]|uniref:Bifunctional protein PutA n=1 Tax=Palleronia marisminoris TaxID=315423 RepID=A0A1Y5RIT8_9RHOB|nr:bifunctional proline dehydrogenase/L-glutamate gamma-semialdehyde dehydrogenase PutA [Palleronia marisminoris]SFG23842.1 L-proline dehydrogenase /delta-1-pyrroline-5-carboxylate dehydrogenase [Palleronia marisminoris]SLN18630.1 Bifunctional protein PutA [Palleronia marisminoris]
MPRDTMVPPPMLPITPYPDPDAVLQDLIGVANLDSTDREEIHRKATKLVKRLRTEGEPGLMEVFLSEYGLSTEEGVALMCLAEALLRVPDAVTIDELIEDKIAPGKWSEHLGKSSSSLVNASTWALMFTGRVLDERDTRPLKALRGAVKRMGEPVIRRATDQAMRVMGRQFVLGQTMEKAMDRAAKMEAKGYTYSYDMLGEAAQTYADAERYRKSYADAIAKMSKRATKGDIASNPGISVKFSALHPRYEVSQRERVLEELVPVVRDLAAEAARLKIGFNVDAEEQDRLTLSLEVIERVLEDERLAGWNGFGIVVQAYGPRAGATIDWIAETAERLDRKLMVRLVKGAYWDTEIKIAQQEGLPLFPVYSRKPATDVSFLGNARKLLRHRARIYPQFATHNAHTVAAVLHMVKSEGAGREEFEFQRLHGMGESLYNIIMADENIRCRIYAPVGAHRDLLAYLVRRLLENGANSSFVNQIVNEEVPAEQVAEDPYEALGYSAPVTPGTEIFLPHRRNARGWDLSCADHLEEIEAARHPFRAHRFEAAPLLAGEAQPDAAEERASPSDPSDIVGEVRFASEADVETALTAARPWTASKEERRAVLERVADLYEENFGELFGALAREAGKTLPDAVAELREAVDFLNFYAAEIEKLDSEPLGRFVCISPWNFPLAIFTGQIAAALAAGNAVLAKPAEQAPLVGAIAARLMHEAGVPREVLQFLPGAGDVGARLTGDSRIDGVAFTGSTEVARMIKCAMAENAHPAAPLIAETGGLNAMIVDSTALPEQAVQALMESAFQSAGQRCSACRCVYVQEDIATGFLEMLTGAMEAFRPTEPWMLASDSGPLIDGEAHEEIAGYLEKMRAQDRVIYQSAAPDAGYFLGPALVRVKGIEEIEREVFGPVLHVATFKAKDLDRVIQAINSRAYGLTFGLHTRIDDRVQYVTDRIKAGNLYVNRNQIGAIVGSQPFGGEGLSGTGPKAGGPFYMPRFQKPCAPEPPKSPIVLPGPTGESNRLHLVPRPAVLCLGPTEEDKDAQIRSVERLGGKARRGDAARDLSAEPAFGAVLWWGDEETARDLALQLARREGPLLALQMGQPIIGDVFHERHLCVDTTASGGNAQLLAEVAQNDPRAKGEKPSTGPTVPTVE